MKNKIVSILGIIISIITLIYFESIVYNLIELIGINIKLYSNNIQMIFNIIIKLAMCFIIYIIYKKEFRRRTKKSNLLKNIFILIIGLIIISIIMYLFNYFLKLLSNYFNISLIHKEYFNIFNKQLTLNLIITIITDYVITPFLYCSIIILSIDKITKRNNALILLSGLLAGAINAFSLTGTLGFVVINSLSMFLLFSILAFLYKKTNSISFVIILYSFYLLSSTHIIGYLR